MLLSILPTLSFPKYVHKSVLYVCICTAALQIGSSVPSLYRFLLLLLLNCFSWCDPIDGKHWSGLPFPSPVHESESEVAQSCLTLSDPMDCSTPGLPIHHQLPEPTQTHVCWVSDAIQPSHLLSSPSPPALNLSQYQSLQMSQLSESGG